MFTSASTINVAFASSSALAPAPESAVGTRGGGCRRAPLEVVTVTLGSGIAWGLTGGTGSTTGCRNILAPLKRTCVGAVAAVAAVAAEAGAGVSSCAPLNRTRFPSASGAKTGTECADTVAGIVDASKTGPGPGTVLVVIADGPALICVFEVNEVLKLEPPRLDSAELFPCLRHVSLAPLLFVDK